MTLWDHRGAAEEPEMSGRDWMRRGADHLDSDLEEAERCYRKAIQLDASLDAAWFDLGLIAKWRQQWAECLDLNRRAASHIQPDDMAGDPAFWNAGIAATALSDWESARWAWRSFGIPLSDGDGELHENFGLGVVRLPDQETVWGRRIDPARMQLLSIPLPESGFRCDDIVLHDGEPVGSRVSRGHEYSVFNAIERWRESRKPTVSVEVEAEAMAVERLLEMADEADIPAENWTTSVVVHCAACSLGQVDYNQPGHNHTHDGRDDGTVTLCGFSGIEADIRALLDRWAGGTTGTVLDLTVHC